MSRKGRSRKFYQGNPLENDLRECRRVINKILGQEKLTKREWAFLNSLPGAARAEEAKPSADGGGREKHRGL